MKQSIIGAFLVFSAVCCAATVSAADVPNVVMIISDDQGWTDYSFMGHEHVETPHIDRLAKESLTFTRGYVPDSLCRPSLATLITGLYPHQHGIVGNNPPLPEELQSKPRAQQRRDPRYLEIENEYLETHIDRAPKLPVMLHEKLGYLSHQSGKWWEGQYTRGGFTHGMTHGDRTRGGRHGDEGLVIGRQGLEPIYEFIGTADTQDKPFFIWYAPFMPHSPHNPPERLLAKYRDKTPHLEIAKYWAMCEWFDETVGQLLNHLDEQGLSENTIVLYVTDNGWQQLTDSDSGQFGRGGSRAKRSPYDLGTRTPIMIRWPGHVEPRTDTTHLASSIDLAPTILRAVGLEPTEEMQGVNLLDEKAVAKRQAVYGEIFEHDVQHMTDPAASLLFRWVIDGEWKLILPHPARQPDARPELYHITTDSHETKDLAADKPELVERFTVKLNAWWPAEDSRSTP